MRLAISCGVLRGGHIERPRKTTPKWLLPRHFRRQKARRCTRRLEPASYCRSATSTIGQRWRLGNRRKCCGSALRARWPVTRPRTPAQRAPVAPSTTLPAGIAIYYTHILFAHLPAGRQKKLQYPRCRRANQRNAGAHALAASTAAQRAGLTYASSLTRPSLGPMSAKKPSLRPPRERTRETTETTPAPKPMTNAGPREAPVDAREPHGLRRRA